MELDRPWLDEAPAAEQVDAELAAELVAAMQRVPELAGRDLSLSVLSGGITNRNFVVSAPTCRSAT